MPETFPCDAKRLIPKMLSTDPTKRPQAKEVRVIELRYASSAGIDGYTSPK